MITLLYRDRYRDEINSKDFDKNRKYLDRNDYIESYICRATIIYSYIFLLLYSIGFFIDHRPDIYIFGIYSVISILVISILFIIKINNISRIKIYRYEPYKKTRGLSKKRLFVISAVHYFLCISLLICIFIDIKNVNTKFSS